MSEREILDLCALITEGHNLINKVDHTLRRPLVLENVKKSIIISNYAQLTVINEKIKPYQRSGILEIEELAESFDNLLKTSYVKWMTVIDEL